MGQFLIILVYQTTQPIILTRPLAEADLARRQSSYMIKKQKKMRHLTYLNTQSKNLSYDPQKLCVYRGQFFALWINIARNKAVSYIFKMYMYRSFREFKIRPDT